MSWHRESYRHSLAARGIKTSIQTPIDHELWDRTYTRYPAYVSAWPNELDYSKLDEHVRDTIRILNEKGYPTRWSCEGSHPGGSQFAYFTYKGDDYTDAIFEANGYEVIHHDKDYSGDNYGYSSVHFKVTPETKEQRWNYTYELIKNNFPDKR